MANKPPVHVEPRESGWAVIREGNERATSLHQTQAEAAMEGRDVAHKGETSSFFTPGTEASESTTSTEKYKPARKEKK